MLLLFIESEVMNINIRKMTDQELVGQKKILLEELEAVKQKKKDAEVKIHENYNFSDPSVSGEWAEKRDEAVVEARRLINQIRIVSNELSRR
ncbi:hypothetical protein GKF24_24555 [Escherichia coli]|jgi:hypothetical protein|nr:hypothetical protein [Escherichia coli]MSH49699.1 hypothetical protein [Escherichia coli]